MRNETAFNARPHSTEDFFINPAFNGYPQFYLTQRPFNPDFIQVEMSQCLLRTSIVIFMSLCSLNSNYSRPLREDTTPPRRFKIFGNHRSKVLVEEIWSRRVGMTDSLRYGWESHRIHRSRHCLRCESSRLDCRHSSFFGFGLLG